MFVTVWRRSRQLSGGSVTFQEIRQRCAERVAHLEIPVPFDFRTLCERLGHTRGRPIRLVPMPLPVSSPCGLWVTADGADLIFYDTQTSTPHREHIVLHELGHLVCDHEPAPVDGDEASQLVVPHLAPAAVQRVLGRTVYSNLEEQEAELVGSLIAQRAERARAAPPPPPAGTAARITRALEGPDGP